MNSTSSWLNAGRLLLRYKHKGGKIIEKSKGMLNITLRTVSPHEGRKSCDRRISNQGKGHRVKFDFLPWFLDTGVFHIIF